MLTRDVRLTADEIVYLRDLTRRRISDLGRKISTAEGRASEGHTVQRGTLARHYREVRTLCETERTLEVARQQIARRVADSLARGRDTDGDAASE